MSGEVASQVLRGRKLGMLLSTDPRHPNLETGLGLARAALDRGVITASAGSDRIRSISTSRYPRSCCPSASTQTTTVSADSVPASSSARRHSHAARSAADFPRFSGRWISRLPV